MNDILSMVTSRLSGDTLSTISRQIGADEPATSGAIGALIPVILSTMASNASKPAAASRLNQALAEDHDGGLLDNLGGFLGNPEMGDGTAILGHIFGGRQSKVESGVAGGTGLNAGQVAQLMAILAPIIMAALGKAKRNKDLDAGGLSEMLGKESAAAKANSGGLLGSLSSMLDADGDGSAIDDLGRMAGGFFSKK